MKKIILLLAWATIATSITAQEYHPHDLGKLKAFLVQPSGDVGKTNGEQLGLSAADMSTIDTDDSWIVKFSRLLNSYSNSLITWSNTSPKRITSIYFMKTLTDDRGLSGSLDMSGCDSLTSLNCAARQITSLNVSGCPLLQHLSCFQNQLTTLNINGCPLLSYLSCDVNRLTTLDVRGCPLLTYLYCGNNQLTTLDVRSCPLLEWFNCSDNQLKMLDVSNCPLLEVFYCYNNQLTTLDVSNNTSLTMLACENNLLTDVTVGATPIPYFAPDGLNIRLGNISSAVLHVPSGTKSLYRAAMGWRDFGYILEPGDVKVNYHPHDLGKLKAFLVQPSAESGKTNGEQLGLTAADMLILDSSDDWVSKVVGVTWVTSGEVGRRISSVGARSVGGVYEWDNKSLAGNLDLSGCVLLSYLQCRINRLTSIGVTGCTNLGIIWCTENHLTSLDVSTNTALHVLYCSNSFLTELDVSNCPLLDDFQPSSNRLTALDVSHNPKLRVLMCGRNPLTILDVSHNPKLTSLECGGTFLTTLDLTHNPELFYLYCPGTPSLADMIVPFTTPLPDTKMYDSGEFGVVWLGGVAGATLHVPQGTVSLYRSANEWNRFGKIVEQGRSGFVSESYHAHDLSKLRSFMSQSSSMSGKTNGEWCGLTKAEVTGIDGDDAWVSKVGGITWSESVPRRIKRISWSWGMMREELSGYFDMSGCELLDSVGFIRSKVYSIDVSGCASLRYLDCQGSPEIYALNVNGCTSLGLLWCFGGKVSSLDLSSCVSLWYLGFAGNELKELDVSYNLRLSTLDVWSSRLTKLDLSNNLSLSYLVCENCSSLMSMTVGFAVPLSAGPNEYGTWLVRLPDVSKATLHVPAGTADLYRAAAVWRNFGTIIAADEVAGEYASHDLSRLRSFLQQVPTKSVSSNGELLGLTSDDMSTWLTSDAWVEKLAGVTWDAGTPRRIISIDWHDRGLCGVLDVSGLSSLSSLNCSQNVITSLDISSLPALSELWCHGNPLSDITVSWQEPKSITSLGSGGSDWMLLHLPLVLSSTLHVPAGSAALYRAADGWGMFRTITESPYVANINVARPSVFVFVIANTLTINSPSSEVITLYSLSGVTLLQEVKDKGITTINLSRLPKGVILVSGSSGWTRKILR